MISLEKISEQLGTTDPWVENRGAYWLAATELNVRDVARVMNEVQARFVTITAYQRPDEDGFRLEYHWDLDGRLLGFSFPVSGNSIDSIYDICEGVDWIEREVHEGFAVDFLGREYEPLLLREGDTLGVNLREVSK
ncbi:MAG: NADH-quinone oxidoreductase subunit C [Terracidiphilus sp.]|jgi:NADH:ubiquinone oxidoreductase subunit C